MAFAARPRAMAKSERTGSGGQSDLSPDDGVAKTRAKYLGVELEAVPRTGMVLEAMPDVFGVLFQYPDGEGVTADLTAVIEQAKAHEAQVVAADLMALALLKNPGTMGADVIVGTTQRFGVPMGYGGPHAASLPPKNLALPSAASSGVPKDRWSAGVAHGAANA